jgi:hypothetical protein
MTPRRTSCQLSTLSPLTSRMRSPRRNPAWAAEELASTPPMTAGMSGKLITSMPTMKTREKTRTARTMLAAGPAR